MRNLRFLHTGGLPCAKGLPRAWPRGCSRRRSLPRNRHGSLVGQALFGSISAAQRLIRKLPHNRRLTVVG